MKTLSRKILKWLGILSLIPAVYFIIALVLSYITVNDNESTDEKSHEIFLNSNGVHLDIVFLTSDLEDEIKEGLLFAPEDQYLSFGWGDEGFYLNTPTWGDLTFKTAFNAAFMDTPTLMHLTPYQLAEAHWIKIKVSDKELKLLKSYVLNSFQVDERGKKGYIPNHSYGDFDTFYKANGTYSLFKTCNTWVNTAFKKSGLKAAFWTPFDFGLMNKYK